MQWFNLSITGDGGTLLSDFQMSNKELTKGNKFWSDDWSHNSLAKGELTINATHQHTVTISVTCSKGYHLRVIISLIV